MLLDCLLIIVGVAMVLRGADRLTEGAAAIARRMNVSEMVIGLTIVAAGTSAPELFVSVVSALNDTPDLAVGNVVGSNIMNTMLIVGVSAMVAPMVIRRSTVVKDMPFTVLATLLLAVLCLDGCEKLSLAGNTISRADGVLLLLAFALFMAYTFSLARKGGVETGGDDAPAEPLPVWKAVLFAAMGLAFLIVGSKLFVGSATAVAETLGVSQSIIGLTIVAGGTSLPELATSVVAAKKGQSAMAIGNVIGSNVFNILLILGLTATICPMQIGGITLIDMAVMLLSVILLWLFSFTKLKVERWEGAVLTVGYVAYTAWLLSQIG